MYPFTLTCKSWPTNKNIYNGSVRTQDVVEKTHRKRWMRETNGESESGKSVLTAHHDDDDDDDILLHIHIYTYIYTNFTLEYILYSMYLLWKLDVFVGIALLFRVAMYCGDLGINNKTPNRMLTRRLPYTKSINVSLRIGSTHPSG